MRELFAEHCLRECSHRTWVVSPKDGLSTLVPLYNKNSSLSESSDDNKNSSSKRKSQGHLRTPMKQKKSTTEKKGKTAQVTAAQHMRYCKGNEEDKKSATQV